MLHRRQLERSPRRRGPQLLAGRQRVRLPHRAPVEARRDEVRAGKNVGEQVGAAGARVCDQVPPEEEGREDDAEEEGEAGAADPEHLVVEPTEPKAPPRPGRKKEESLLREICRFSGAALDSETAERRI